ncbi:curli production assembly/transport component [Escherichia coli]|nr:curli production assembly/transport component [Escherichia coli]CTW68889.1 curli production assembly/transport component [Escherichia coli]
MFTGKKSAQIREILISESAWEEMTCLFAPSLDNFTQAIQSQILGGLLSNINTGKPGRMVTNDYIVDIANRDGQLQLNVTDRKTGQTSTIQVSGLQNNSTDF